MKKGECPRCGAIALNLPSDTVLTQDKGAALVKQNQMRGLSDPRANLIAGGFFLASCAAKAILSTPYRCPDCKHEWRNWF